ncbi:hypothetical protein B0A49_02258 [Cryomyces minteri]|uniref:Nucleolar protein 16 n=1 Tax=Cryomyces minteri TaxID=331657 RepID=A0A4U0XJ69_9PEZI|nr:hypothetical protein B0A49_02258 [Cryomyces minteri]
MGRELQKKKNKSSISKVKHKPKSKKKLLMNPIVAANWNQKETLSQNYRRLGLATKLNHATGGIEDTASTSTSTTTSAAAPTISSSSSLAINNLGIKSRPPTTLLPTEARIERDPSTGAILRVLDDRSSSARPNPLNDPLNELDSEDEEDSADDWTPLDNQHWPATSQRPARPTGHTPVIRQLEALAATGVKKAPRKQSAREEEWVGALVAKYGHDVKSMVRDKRLNVMQQSEGDIKRRVEMWRRRHEGVV